MSTDYVYFFRHIGVKGVKIGKTSGESVLSRFNSFKTYSPHGAEIIGFFKCSNGNKSEKELHKRFSNQRLQGEFFDISDDIIESILIENNDEYIKAKKVFNEWISNTENNIDKLLELMKVSNESKLFSSDIEYELLKEHLKSGNNKRNATEIHDYLKTKFNGKLSVKKIGAYCRLNFTRTSVREKGYCYLVDFILSK